MQFIKRYLLVFLIVLLLASIMLAAGNGAMHIHAQQVIAILLKKMGIRLNVECSEGMENILWQLRLPRVCLGILVGAALGISGAAMQGLFRNPLADPGLIGISAGASLFAVLTIVVLVTVPAISAHTSFLPQYYLLNVLTFMGACITSLLVFRMSRIKGKTLIATLLLAGIAVNALCGACTGLITYNASNEQLRNITFWSLGSLGGASWQTVLALLPFVLPPLCLMPFLGKALNAYSLGEAEAGYIGIHVKALKWKIILLSTMAVGASVAVAGIIGFVGLITPHILRTVSGSDHRRLLLNSALLGASLLTLADVVSRTIIAPAELPIGIMTALLGTPLFIMLLLKQKKQILTA
ncbi:FecCD family ABC transporter permease [Parafilimonas sp.]|uniref:FecCD family ABC transporter permease n=1 Tax=Parafilimonas sp. TaxID=1969739 RepID=UPI0039E51187